MNHHRRNFLRGTTFLGAGLVAGRAAAAQHQHPPQPVKPAPSESQPREPQKTMTEAAKEKAAGNGGFLPVQTPDLAKLPFQIENGVKVFHLVAEPVKRAFLPSKVVDVWGYNGSMPGPMIEIEEGDRVRIIVTNKLPEATSMHWHGLEVPIEMDGAPAISQPLIMPGETFTYEFTLHQHGTFFYHSHMPMQEMMGMIGFFIIHPKRAYEPRVDKDFGLILQEWAILPNNTIPNTLAMEFNWLTLNGRAGPDTTPLIVKLGERVRIRFVNLGMDHHPMHLHGTQFYVTGTEGGRIPPSAWYPGNTVLVGVAQARDVEFVANNPGDWMLHCHLPHHMMNQMASMVGPMSHAGHGLQTGLGMEEGMGLISRGHALSDELGPGLGRGMGMTTQEKAVSHLVGQHGAEQAAGQEMYVCPMHPDVKSDKPGQCSKCGMALVPLASQNQRVPGYPQDMWVTMDEEVAKPETYGLAPGWTGAMMGMMTLVRVLPPEKYEEVMARIKEGRKETPKAPRQIH
jgi:FtsP/CotA-like multicopper oxidase with cupredoxin domain